MAGSGTVGGVLKETAAAIATSCRGRLKDKSSFGVRTEPNVICQKGNASTFVVVVGVARSHAARGGRGATWQDTRACGAAVSVICRSRDGLRSAAPRKRGSGFDRPFSKRAVCERSAAGGERKKSGKRRGGARKSAQALAEDGGEGAATASTLEREDGAEDEEGRAFRWSGEEYLLSAADLAPGKGGFNWLRSWYPVAMADGLDKRLTHARTILGRRLVLWWDGNVGRWQAFLDLCPHRLAPLSEGRIHESGGLQCCYHGWVFDGEGACTLIPQAPKDDDHDDQTAGKGKSRRSNSDLIKPPQCRAVVYPCKEHQRMLWVWLDADAQEDAEANPPPTVPAIDDDYYWTDLSVRDLPYSYEALTENLVDTSHVNFAHHNMLGGGKRDSSRSTDFYVTKVSPTAVEAWSVAGAFRTELRFFPPSLILIEITRGHQRELSADEPSGTSAESKRPIAVLTWYCTPVAPGRSRLFWGIHIGGWPKYIPKFPVWWVHIFWRLLVLDSDLVMLHRQDHMREHSRLERGKNWRSEYYMPTASDGVVVGMRKWLRDHAGGSPMWPKDLNTSLPVTNDSDRELLMDRKRSHVDHCVACRGALKSIEIVIKVLQILSIGLIASVAAAAAAQVALATRVGPGLVLFAGVCALLSVGLQALRSRFFYRPFVHALWP